MDFKLNFVGVTVCDFETSFKFYTETLGMIARDTKPGWALFDTTGMTFELFGGGEHMGGENQTVVPSLHVAEVENVIEDLRRKGVEVDSEIMGGQGTVGVRIVAPEGLHWYLADTVAYRSGDSLRKPNIGVIYMSTRYDKVDSLHRFYEQMLGKSLSEGDSHRRVFRQGPGEPELIILDDLAEGKQRAPISNRREAPHYLSFETADIERAADWVRSHEAHIIQEVTHHEWGGIDLQLADPDNNPVQIVQYT